jgi:putative ABC transport system permease protein
MAGLFIGLISAYTATLDRSRADVMVLSPDAKSILNSNGIPRRIMPLVYRHPDVVEVRDLDGDWGRFYGPRKPDPSNVNVSIIDPIADAVTLPTDFTEAIRETLAVPFNIAVDRTALRKLGVELGDMATFNGRTVRVAYVLDGYPNFDNPGIIMSRQTLRLLRQRGDGDRLGPLMIRVRDPAQAERVRDELNAISDGQYNAWTRAQLRKATLKEFLEQGIIALFLYAATGLGFFVGVIITWQTLNGAILANIKELASLRALGVSMGSLRYIVMEISFWVGVAGLCLTAVLMTLLTLAAKAGGVPMGFQLNWVVTCCILLMVIALASGFFSLGVLKKSQPADLLR